jgi:hypothetical protein
MSNDFMIVNDEFDGIGKAEDIAQFGVLPLHLPGRNDENYEELHSG